MTCDAVRERFSDLMDGEMDESVRPRIEEHLTSCGSCRLEWAKFRQTVDAVRGMPQLSAPKGFVDDIRQQLERAELLDREGIPPPSRTGWKRPLMLFAAAAVVLVVARVGLQSREPIPPSPTLGRSPEFSANAVPVVPESALENPEAPDPNPQEALQQEKGGGEGVPTPRPDNENEAAKDLQADASREQDRALPDPALPSPPAAPAAPAGPPPPAAEPGKAGPALALAWVMPCASAEAGERRLRDAFEPVDEASRDSKERETGREDRVAGLAASRMLVLRVPAPELQDTVRRLESLGARPAAAEAASPDPAGKPSCGLQGAVSQAAAPENRPGVAGIGLVREKKADALGQEAKEAGNLEKRQEARALEEAPLRARLKATADAAEERKCKDEEGWIILTVVLEPAPETPPPAEKP